MDPTRPRTPLETAHAAAPKAAPTPPPAPKKARPSEPRLGSLSRHEVASLQSMFRDAVEDAADAGALSRVTDDEAQGSKGPRAPLAFPAAREAGAFEPFDAAPAPRPGAPRRRWSPTAAQRRDRSSPTNVAAPRKVSCAAPTDRDAKRSPRRSARGR